MRRTAINSTAPREEDWMVDGVGFLIEGAGQIRFNIVTRIVSIYRGHTQTYVYVYKPSWQWKAHGREDLLVSDTAGPKQHHGHVPTGVTRWPDLGCPPQLKAYISKPETFTTDIISMYYIYRVYDSLVPPHSLDSVHWPQAQVLMLSEPTLGQGSHRHGLLMMGSLYCSAP